MKKPSPAEALRPMGRVADMTSKPAAKVRKRSSGKPPALVQPGRAGKKPLMGYYSPECVKQFKQITLDRDTTQQDLLAEALNDLFQKYSKAPIA
jgi:hypothetical protein